MENHKLVMPEHLNQFGFLFGGHLLKWIDEVAWIAVTLAYPGCRFVTVAMNRVEFKRSVREGAILKFTVDDLEPGTTSVMATARVWRDSEEIFSTDVILVRIDESGRKTPLP